MEQLVDGWSIKEWLVQFGPIGEGLGKYILKQLIEGISHMHMNEISHGQLTNEAIMIAKDTFNIKIGKLEYIHKSE